MMRSQPEPWNFKYARLTPKWAFKQSSRRALVIALCVIALFVTPLLFGSLGLVDGTLWMGLIATTALLFCLVCVAWLIGATHAKADSPDEYLDEREIAMRNEVYLNSFRIIGALIGLGFTVFTVFPDTPIPAKAAFSLLFPIVMFLPTCVLAWTQPDSLEEG